MMTPLLSSSRVKFIISQNILGMMWDNRWKLMWNWSCCIYHLRYNNTAILFIVPLASFTHLGISARSLKIGGLNPPRSILFRFSLQCAPPPDDTSHPSIHLRPVVPHLILFASIIIAEHKKAETEPEIEKRAELDPSRFAALFDEFLLLQTDTACMSGDSAIYFHFTTDPTTVWRTPNLIIPNRGQRYNIFIIIVIIIKPCLGARQETQKVRHSLYFALVEWEQTSILLGTEEIQVKI